MDDDALRTRLRDFGLSDKEVSTYLTILDHGEAKASVIADEAGVSKRYVYSVADDLETRGFVEVNDHAVPTTIKANPPDEVIGKLTSELQEIGPALESRFTATPETLEQFEVVKSRQTVHKRLNRLIQEADLEITVSIPITTLPEVEDELRNAVDRGVLVILLLTGINGGRVEADLEGLASVARVWSERMPTMLTADFHYGLIAPNEMLVQSNSGMQAIALAQHQLVPVLVGSFLGNYWQMADEAYHTEPAELPASYVGFRHAVLQAALHRRAGTNVYASVDARPVQGEGSYETIEGEIVSVSQSLLKPATNSFPVENSLVIRTDTGTVSVGGEGAFIEEYEAREVVLHEE